MFVINADPRTTSTTANIPDHRFGLVPRDVQRTKELLEEEVPSHFWSATRGSPVETGNRNLERAYAFPVCKKKGKYV